MKSRSAVVLAIAGLLAMTSSAAQAEQLTYKFTGVITSTSGTSAAPLSQLNSLGIGTNSKIYGTISFDDDAPGSKWFDGGEWKGTGVNMTTTFYVPGTDISYNLGPHVNDRIGTFVAYDYHPIVGSVAFSRELQYPVKASYPDTGLTAPGGEVIRATEFDLSIRTLASILLENSWLENFPANFPTMPAGAATEWNLSGTAGIPSGGSLSLRGTINSFALVPEPSTLALAAIGALALAVTAAHRRFA